MDQTALVADGHALVRSLDASGFPVRAAVWVLNPDSGSWKLWIVPPPGCGDQRDFYRRIVKSIASLGDGLKQLDPADVEMVSDSHPGIVAMQRVWRIEGLAAVRMSNNVLNGFFLPESIILRMAV